MNKIRILLTITVMLQTVSTIMLSVLGMDWITVGQGLHPAIAFPAATIIALSALFIPQLEQKS
jgi:hypothetical protein